VNVWLVNHYANPPSESGDARHYNHARELRRRGYQARIVACSFNHMTHRYMRMTSGRTWEHQEIEGVPFTWIRACPYRANMAKRILNMFQFTWRACRRNWAAGLPAPDLVMGSTPHPFSALAAERLASRYGVPFILEVRDPWPYVLTEIGRYSPSHPFVALVDKTMRYLYARAARIVMFSRDSSDLLVRYGADAGKIVWIPHGVDLRVLPAPRPAPEDGQFTVTYVGAHNQWNSLDAILDAAKLLQTEGATNVGFRFVGGGASKPGLIARARSEGLRNVRFDGPVVKRDVPEIMHASDAFIINNHNDGVSKQWMSFQKIYDYLAAGRPIVFGCCSPNDPVRESGAGISVEADNPTELAGAIRALSRRSPEELWEFGVRGRRYMEKTYNLPLLVNRFEAMIAEITGNARQGIGAVAG